MARIIGIAGSVRRGSYNAALLRAAAELAPSGLTVDVASIAGIPLYDGDEEAATGIPAAVAALKDRVAAADGILLVTPEYNNSLPGVFKNAIDWMTRPANDIARVFGDKPVALLGTTPGPGGTRLAQAAWLPVLRLLGVRVWAGKSFYGASAHKAFDAEGRLVDETSRRLLTEFMAGFAGFVGAGR